MPLRLDREAVDVEEGGDLFDRAVNEGEVDGRVHGEDNRGDDFLRDVQAEHRVEWEKSEPKGFIGDHGSLDVREIANNQFTIDEAVAWAKDHSGKCRVRPSPLRLEGHNESCKPAEVRYDTWNAILYEASRAESRPDVPE